jgi:hypothetical protein
VIFCQDSRCCERISAQRAKRNANTGRKLEDTEDTKDSSFPPPAAFPTKIRKIEYTNIDEAKSFLLAHCFCRVSQVILPCGYFVNYVPEVF